MTVLNRCFMGLVLVFATVTTAPAATISINTVGIDGGSVGFGPGSGRGIGFKANSTFSISSVGLYSDLGRESYDVLIYSSTNGHQVNSVLASASQIVGGTGLTWHDISIDFSPIAGNFYAINWRPSDGSFSNLGPGGFHYGLDSSLPYTTGPLTLIDGTEGFNAVNFTNSLHPQLRITTVPEPATLALIAFGLAGFGVAKRRQKA